MKYTIPMSDLRERRTRRLIFDGFLSILSHKLFSKITINDISNAALIHRNTFYHHFNDKYELLRDMIRDKLGDLLTDSIINGFNEHPFTTIQELYANYFQKLFAIQVHDEQFKKIIWQEFLSELIRRNNGEKNFWAIGGFSVIMDWNDINHQPYDLFEDYQRLDEIYQSHHLPKLNISKPI